MKSNGTIDCMSGASLSMRLPWADRQGEFAGIEVMIKNAKQMRMDEKPTKRPRISRGCRSLIPSRTPELPSMGNR